MPEFIHSLTVLCLLLCIASIGRKGQGHPALFRSVWVVAAILFVLNAWMAKALPFGNMRHVLCFFPIVLVPAAVWLHRRRRLELTAWFALASAVALVGALCMPMQAAWRQMPALQSPWFAPHVTSYVIAYGLMSVAAGLAVKSFWDESELSKADAVVRLAFPFLTFGLWSGALWADAAWGHYWAWDIKEVWSLLTWSICLIYFHASAHLPTWRRPLLLLGFAAVVVTFLVVNLLPQLESAHSYAM